MQAVAQQQIYKYWKMGTSNYPKTDHSIESVIIVKNNISGFTLDKDFPHSLHASFMEHGETYHRSTCKDVNVKKAAGLVKSLKPH